MNYLLDTTVLLDYAHGRPSAVKIVEHLFGDGEALYTCDVVTCEALSGGDALERRAIRGVLDALEFVAIAPADARWAADARRAGRPTPGARSLADALIGSAARSLDATVVTRNPRDFVRLGTAVLAYA
ncbi:MAG: PIN domain-containing protein [Chloroflexota bacterium]|nr:MAG: PIN domain-containing protein [Chloroflexota bacterium]